jgi:diketogulonate reductase-like aldo/keto reductase
VNGALERLGLEYVDLIYAHRPDRNTPIEETVRAFNHIINTGKAFYWGTSEWNADEIATAWRYADKLNLIGPVMEQPQYNMLARQKVEKEFEHLYEEVGLGLTIFSPLKIVRTSFHLPPKKIIELKNADFLVVQGILTGKVSRLLWSFILETGSHSGSMSRDSCSYS